MLTVTGLIAIPKEPQLNLVESGNGVFINFKATSQARGQDGTPQYHFWNCSVWVPADQAKKWQDDYIQSGNVLFVEHAQAQSFLSQDGKYTFTKIKLEHNKTKKLAVPLWYTEE